MTEDPIRKLLQQADSLAGPAPAAPPDLAGRVRRSARRRRLAAATSISLLLVIAAVIAAVFVRREAADQSTHLTARPTDRTEEKPDVAKLQAEIDRLQREINMRRAIVAALLEHEKQGEELKRLEAVAARGDPLDCIRRETDRAAHTMVRHAYLLEQKLGRTDLALETYRHVAKLFPDSAWARVARERITKLTSSTGDVT